MSTVSVYPGMGSIPFTGGTTFRVWAKFARQVFVAGSFNDWSQDATPLFPEGNGYWSVDVAGAGKGDQYRFIILDMHDKLIWRTDPYCRNVHDDNNGEIFVDDFDWSNHHFIAPAWNDLIIYELHIASFNRGNNFDCVIERLDYLANLGVNAIELMPIFGYAGAFSMGYNPALPFDIENSYGNSHSLKNLIRTAHEKGIAIILDVVYNHFGPDVENQPAQFLWG